MLFPEIRTPAALVDLQRLEANTAMMSEKVRRLGAKLRPHVKTHKCAEAARFQTRGHSGAIAVSTLAEARFMADAGFRDITYAVPVAPSKLVEACEIASGLDVLHLLLDHERTFEAMEECARSQRAVFSAFLKVDCGYHRAGVDPENPASVKLALRMEASPHVRLAGFLTHAGHSYHCQTADEVATVARDERRVMIDFAAKLKAEGVTDREVSIGSTPTMMQAASLEGVSEVRPGNYVFFDAFQASVGSCELKDVAFSVLVSVLSHYPEREEILIDAGALSLSRDEGPTHVDPSCGFGVIYSAENGERLEGASLVSLSQEHGKIRLPGSGRAEQVPVGSKLRIVPNHSCLSSAMFDRYHVIRGEEVVEEWRPAKGW